jgi:hypothetical protein
MPPQRDRSERERLNPGTTPPRTSPATPPDEKAVAGKRRRHGAALPGSPNADLRGTRRRRGPRGAST